MQHTWKNAPHLKKKRHTWINAPHLVDKLALNHVFKTLGKMEHTWKNAPHLRKCGTLEKMRHT